MSSNENVGPVYLKHRTFNESGYGRQSQQSLLFDDAVDQSSYSAFGSNGKTANFNLEIQDDRGMPVNYARVKALEEIIRKDIVSDKNSLHRAITPVLTLANFFALLPVQGIKGQNTSYLTFNWFTWMILYVLVVFVSCFLIILLSSIRIYQVGLTYYGMGNILFFGSTLVIYIIFVHLAKQWPKVMGQWELMEREMMRQFRNPIDMAYKFKKITSIVMVLSIVEYITTLLTGIVKAVPCSTGGLDIIRAYFSTTFRQVFTVIDYSLILAIPLEFLNLIMVSAWNFMDLFIILLACALSDRFKQLNQRLANVKGKVLPNTYWRKSRETYNLLASLTEDFDEFLSPVVFLSFSHNLYFICFQLLNSLKLKHGSLETVCFVFLFTYLVGRTCAVTLYAASINDESKKSKIVLFSVPTESYCTEVARFLTQVTSGELALTGYNFFSVTRTFMLTVAGTIVTYEIVLLQFNTAPNETIDENNTLNYCP
ncbi:Gustatory receptor [Cinara cedri]|uniref:Gustatory receptor n=1 Tax=Cinara cedri TaxID=506608 RepID=A0A5E4MPJ6_9HEMI|nr:Gustatory receptor [Cinara cedri]